MVPSKATVPSFNNFIELLSRTLAVAVIDVRIVGYDGPDIARVPGFNPEVSSSFSLRAKGWLTRIHNLDPDGRGASDSSAKSNGHHRDNKHEG
ncbi:MAG: hypothetical protein ACREYE_03060 [Gammaproteobacteria bacterium]